MDNVRRNLYEIIGVSPSASREAIEKACMDLARDNRPDEHPGSESAAQLFAEVETAYATLTNPQERAKYDAALLRERMHPPNQESIHARKDSFSVYVLLAAILPIIALAFWGHLDESTFHGDELSILAAAMGIAAVGLVLLAILRRTKLGRDGLALVLAFLCLLGWIISGSAVSLNRLLAFGEPREREFTVLMKTERTGYGDHNWYWHIVLAGPGGEIFSHRFNYGLAMELKPRMKVRFTVLRGLFGYEFFTGFRVLDMARGGASRGHHTGVQAVYPAWLATVRPRKPGVTG